jgi:hypothetical protein
MWPFKKKRAGRSDEALATIDRAIDFVAQRWLAFSVSVPVRPGTPLRDRIGLFARSLDSSLLDRFPALAAASEQVILLIVAKGVEQSGAIPRGEIERALGISLPP